MKPDTARWRVLILSTIAFTLLFNVWLMLGVLGLKSARSSISRPRRWSGSPPRRSSPGRCPRLNFGIWADRFGGRTMTLVLLFLCAVPAYLVCFAHDATSSSSPAPCSSGWPGITSRSGSRGTRRGSPTRSRGRPSASSARERGGVGDEAARWPGPVGADARADGRLPRRLDSRRLAGPAGGLCRDAGPDGRSPSSCFAPTPDRTPGKGRSFADLMGPLRDTAGLAVQPLLRRRLRRLRRAFGLAADLLQGHLRRPAPHGRAADGDVHLPRQPAPPRRRLALRQVRPAGRHLRRVRHDGPGPGALHSPGCTSAFVGRAWRRSRRSCSSSAAGWGSARRRCSSTCRITSRTTSAPSAAWSAPSVRSAASSCRRPSARRVGAAGRRRRSSSSGAHARLPGWLHVVVLGIKARERDRRSREPAVLASPT